MSIDVQYFADSDMLSLRTGAPAAEAAEVAEGVVVEFAAAGIVVGFRLERAAALLRPVLNAAPAVRGEESAMDNHQLEITLRTMGRGEDALENIANSDKLDMGTRQKAAALLAQLRSRP